MTLRTILIVLSLLVLTSTIVGGQLYYSSLKESAYNDARRKAAADAEMIKSRLDSFLSENMRPVRALAELTDIRLALVNPNPQTINRADDLLIRFRRALGVDVCYLMNRRGLTIASSNVGDPDSFVGRNFAFRPYFIQAMKGQAATYMALGTASSKRGAYFSYPVIRRGDKQPLGVAVVKAAIDVMESRVFQVADGIVTLSAPNGVIFGSNRPDLLFNTLWKLTDNEKKAIAASRQFGDGPWPWVGLREKDWEHVVDLSGREYLIYQMDVEHYPGWQVTYLRSAGDIAQSVLDPLLQTTGSVILALTILVGLAVYYLYRRANYDIIRRRVAEAELRESEERYRSLYHNTPAMLHSIDEQGRLISVSDYWVEEMGYDREEVIGHNLTDFLSRESRRLAKDVVLPKFFRNGTARNIPYQFIKKDGSAIDVLLSAITDRDRTGRIVRSLAVLVDITARKRAERALKQAQVQLSRYSKDLERQVRERTTEISSILEHTPAVVYIKDASGRFLLVNSRFEELFGVTVEDIRGLGNEDVLPPELAVRHDRDDERIRREGRSFQVQTEIDQPGGRRTYLTVKFPIKDDQDRVIRIGGVSMDITALKKAQEQLRRVSGGIMARQEKERAAIARELHDELGQVLTALRMDSVWLRENAVDPKAAARARNMGEIIDQTISEVRSIATRLRPAVLDDLGLIDALEWYTNEFEKRTGISCLYRHRDVPEVDNLVATAAYRIAQEAMTNVARHAEAGHLEVSLTVGDGRLRLTVTDDGRGFETDDLDEGEALGVAGMRERAGLVGGRLTITSRPGQGTAVEFILPLGGGSV